MLLGDMGYINVVITIASRAKKIRRKKDYFWTFFIAMTSPSVGTTFPGFFFASASSGTSISLMESARSSLIRTSSSGIRSPFSIFFIRSSFSFSLHCQVFLGEPPLHPGLPDPLPVIVHDLPLYHVEYIPLSSGPVSSPCG